jgi:hypothetical protein
MGFLERSRGSRRFRFSRALGMTAIVLSLGACSWSQPTERQRHVFSDGDSETIPNVLTTTVAADARPFLGGDNDREEPDIPTYQFLLIHISYTAIAPVVSFDRAQWTLLVDRRPWFQFAIARHVDDELFAGELQAGQQAHGTLVYEVPATGALALMWNPDARNLTGKDPATGQDTVDESLSFEFELTR